MDGKSIREGSFTLPDRCMRSGPGLFGRRGGLANGWLPPLKLGGTPILERFAGREEDAVSLRGRSRRLSFRLKNGPGVRCIERLQGRSEGRPVRLGGKGLYGRMVSGSREIKDAENLVWFGGGSSCGFWC